MLRLNNVEVIYSDVILVLKGLSLAVEHGQIVALLGANGAGKTTTLRAISGLLKAEEGRVTDGTIELEGRRIDGRDPEAIVRMGVFQVMEGRRVFENLTVDENLRVGAYTRRDQGGVRRDSETVYRYFPRLKERRRQMAGYLSGGEQPMLVREIFAIVRRLNQEERLTILLVEQNASVALGIADYGYVMEGGRVVLDGPAARLRENEDVKEFYLGLTEMGTRKSYRDVKHYKRRKRWLS